MLSAFESDGFSKSGAELKVTTPEVETLSKALSVPEIEYVSESPSGSEADIVKAEV